MNPTAIPTPKAGMSSRKRSSHKSDDRSRASLQPPGPYDFDFEPLERGAQVLDQALTDSLQFLLRGQDESQRRSAAMLPLGDKGWAMFKLLQARPGTETHRVLTYAILSVMFTDQARKDLTSSGQAGLNGTVSDWGDLLRQAALALQKEMQRVFPEFVVGTGSASQPPVVNVSPDVVRAVVPNRARQARKPANPVA